MAKPKPKKSSSSAPKKVDHGTGRRLPLLLTALLACIGGIVRIWQANGQSNDGYMLAGVGLVLVGAWVAMEIQAEIRRMVSEHPLHIDVHDVEEDTINHKIIGLDDTSNNKQNNKDDNDDHYESH